MASMRSDGGRPTGRMMIAGAAAILGAWTTTMLASGAPAPTVRPATTNTLAQVAQLKQANLDYLDHFNPPPDFWTGRTEITLYTGEFVNWQSELSYYDTPALVTARWRSVVLPPASGRWVLYRLVPIGLFGGPMTQKLDEMASGPLASLPADLDDIVTFKVNLLAHLPLHNNGIAARVYYLTVFTRATPTSMEVQTKRVKLIHLPKGQEVPGPGLSADKPFACTTITGHARKVTLSIPIVSVQQTTSTSGDGDRDELYIKAQRQKSGVGVNVSWPRKPGVDDYFQAFDGQVMSNWPVPDVFAPIPWTNQYGNLENHPYWTMTLQHGETYVVGVGLHEQDNAELKDIRTALISAFSGIAGVATATQNPYGYAVAAVASAAAGMSALIPETDTHDFISAFEVGFTNKCGYIQTTWVTIKSEKSQNGKITQTFKDVQSLTPFNARIVVIAPEEETWPQGVDWTDDNAQGGPLTYAPVIESDEIVIDSKGTSDARYSVVVRARVAYP